MSWFGNERDDDNVGWSAKLKNQLNGSELKLIDCRA
jgi:hypothetical protein